MAVSAKFIADFSDFNDAVQKAEVKLRDFSSGIGRVDKDLAKFGNQFSGTKIIGDATLMAKAVEDIGGASKLTAKEQQQVNTQVTEAIAKFKALGLEAPGHLKALQKETTQQTSLLDKLKGAIGPIGVALAGAFTVTAIVGMGKKVLDFADNLTNLAAKTGISTTGLQKLELAFQGSGVSLDTVTSNVTKLAKNLIDGDKSAVSALDKLGLSAKNLKTLAPEQQFLTVADAVGKIQNPTEKAYAAMAIFGKGGAELLQGLSGHLTETTAEFEKMGLIIDEETVEAADKFGDQLGLMGKQLLGIAANAIGPLLPALSALANLFVTVAGYVGKATGVLVDWVQRGILAAYSAIARFVAGLADAATHIPLLGKHLGIAGTAADALRASADKADAKLTEMFTSTSNVGKAAATSAPALIGLGKATDTAAKAASELKKVQDDLFGRDVVAKARQYVTAIGDVGNVSKLSVEKQKEVSKAVTDAIEVQHRFGVAVDASFLSLRNALTPISKLRDELRQLETVVDKSTESFEHLSRITPPFDAMRNDLIALETTFQTTGIDGMLINLGDDLKRIGQIAKPVLKGLKQQFEDTFGGLNDIFKSAFEGGGGVGGAVQSLATDITASVLETIPVVGKVLSKFAGAIVSGFKAIGRALFGGPSQQELEGRKVVADFEKSIASLLTQTQKLEAGGQKWAMTTIAVRDAYLATGRSATDAEKDVKALWDSSKRGAEAAKEAADKINQAFEEQNADVERLNAAIEKYGFSIEELGPAFRNQRLNEQAKELIEDWRVLVASGINIATVNEKMSGSINEYLTAAIKTGAEVPFAMRPILQSLIDQGKLVDANGNKITDFATAGVTFSETMTQGFDRVVLKLDELIKRLQGAGTEIEGLPSSKVIDIQFQVRQGQIDNIKQQLSDLSWWDRHGSEGRDLIAQLGSLQGGEPIPMAGGGSGTVTRPTLFMAGEAGPEQFAFSGANKGLAPTVDVSGVEERLDSVERHLRDLPRALRIAMQDALALA